MRGDAGSLYDAHAVRLYAHGWSLLGDDAAAAVQDAFVAAVRHPPRGDTVLWMYGLSRTAATSRGAFDRPWHVASGEADPLLRAAAALRAEQREALLLEAGEWLETPDIAHVLGLAPDTVRQLLHAARTRLERGVLDAL
ncbi:sigma factor-like helix-turn-helix DNA-binding protein, partial [Spirillospora sp. NPDC049652]